MFKLKLLSSVYRSPEDEGGAPAADEGNDQKSIAALLDMDFSLPAEKVEGEGDDKGEQKTAPAEEGGEPPAAPEEKPGETAPKTEGGEDPREKELQFLRSQVERLIGQQPPKKEESPPKEETPDYVQEYAKVVVPSELLAKLDSEDPEERRRTFSGVIQGILIRAQADARKYVDENLQRFRGEVPQLATATVQEAQQAEAIQKDFFSTYQQLDKPLLKPLVYNVMFQYGQELQQAGKPVVYSPEFRDEVAKRVVEGLGGTFRKGGAPQGNGKPKARTQPYVSNASARTGTDKGEVDIIADTIGL